MKILLGTKNLGKVKEFNKLLADRFFEIKNLNDFQLVVEPAETGADFVANAVIKARAYAVQTGQWTLADDSGLEADALSGAPGVFSARYGGANATDSEKMKKLLREIDETDSGNRRARFVCAMALANPRGEIVYTTEGICDGEIASQPRGSNGFGYDPVFIPEGFSETFGELSENIKEQISHRARASAKIIEFLRGFIAV